ncbi:MAG: acetyl-CoA carboxylase biotin carboxyl carrier protein [Pirellulaceae bacterium]|nr:acetyl-CoA carboxylase biotin carboxyl carrier protein [Pirellulaceae bacterium]
MSESDQTPSVFDHDQIVRLVELMKEHGLTEVDLREAEQQIRLSRQGVPSSIPSPPVAPVVGQAVPATPAETTEVEPENIKYITSPMVGTFYSRPNPEAPSYAKIGDQVDPEKTVCIIEAMKVFNEIPAEIRGQIVSVLVEDEEAVEFGARLFKVDTNK